MARKRLLSILTAVTVAVGAHAGTASAQTVTLPGAGDVATVDDGCVDVDDLTMDELASLGGDACVTDDGAEIDVDAYLAEQEAPTDSTTDAVSETTKTTTEKVKESTGGGGGDTPSSPSAPSAPTESSGSEGSGGSSGSSGSEAAAPTGTSTTEAAPRGGVVDRPSAAEQRERARQLASIRALRSDLALGTNLDSGVAGPVVPFGGLSSTSDLASPEIADGEVVAGVDERLTPDVADGFDGDDAVLATSSPLPSDQVPLALQLLAAALVLGTGAVWTIARRELGITTDA
jgi:hypothetical protein